MKYEKIREIIERNPNCFEDAVLELAVDNIDFDFSGALLHVLISAKYDCENKILKLGFQNINKNLLARGPHAVRWLRKLADEIEEEYKELMPYLKEEEDR